MKKKNMEKVNLKFVVPFCSGLALLLFVLSCTSLDKNISDKNAIRSPETSSGRTEFVKEGSLDFLESTSQKPIIQIDIEIADNSKKFATGLMYRHSMPDRAGMLFILKQSRPLFFWMKNTYIPLDIIFADEEKQIITIQKNTRPLSKDLIPSNGYAMYVVEVNAGFCDRYGIKIGDYIRF